MDWTFVRRAGVPWQLAAVAALVAVTPVLGQEGCERTADPDGEEWESTVARARALDSIRARVASLVDEDARALSGVVAAYADSAAGRTDVMVDAERLPSAVRDTLVRHLIRHLKSRPLDPGESVVLDLERGAETEIPRKDGEFVTCAPVLQNREEIAELLGKAGSEIVRFMDDAGDENRASRREVLLDVILDRTGGVERVMLAGPSGNPYLNVRAREIGHRMEFEPMTVNGVPVAGWARVPINFSMPEPEE